MIVPSTLRRRFKFLFILAVCLGSATVARAQDDQCLDELPGHVVRSVKIKARWVPEIDLPLKRGVEFTPERLRASRLAVLRAITAETSKSNSEAISLGKLPVVDVRFVRGCGLKVAEAECLSAGLDRSCADIEIRPVALSTDPRFIGTLLLNAPRSNRFSFLSNVPRALRILNPTFDVQHDERIGITPGFSISTNLLTANEIVEGDTVEGKPWSMPISLKVSKSLGNKFYRSEAGVAAVLRHPTQAIDDFAVEASFLADDQPLADLSLRRNIGRVGGRLSFTPNLGVLNRLVVGGGYRWSESSLRGGLPGTSVRNSESSLDLRAIADGRIAGGFVRGAVWLDGGNDLASDSYSRVAALLGYEKEIPVSGHTIGIEAIVGGGWASRSTPAYARFFGGNGPGNFLYQDAIETGMQTMPTGPLLRSFGKNQASLPVAGGIRSGANNYSHFNLSVSLPIPGLSRDLIPNEVVNVDPRVTVRDLIDFAVNTGEESLAGNLQEEGLSEEEAERKAAQIFNEIRPGVKFLTHYGKLYSIKPLLMFDIARMELSGGIGSTRYSVGAGVQLTVVLAKFEAGYLRTLDPLPGDQRGNFVARLVFQNLF